jgi:imidazolonepropionase-like amidohydrolase
MGHARLIDIHTHDGTFALPQTSDPGANDVTETSDEDVANTWIEHAVHPVAPAFARALAGGVTALQILPGSQQIFNGRSVVVKPVRAVTVQQMSFPVRRAGSSFRAARIRRAAATRFRLRAWASSRACARVAGSSAVLPRGDGGRIAIRPRARARGHHRSSKQDLEMDSLAAVLNGELRVRIHCYRADDIAVMLNVAKEFGFQIAAVHHAAEAYKIAGQLRDAGTCAAVWPDWWGFKHEAEDAIPENAAFVDAAGGCAIMHSDIPVLGDRLNVEASKAAAAGRRAGFAIRRSARSDGSRATPRTRSVSTIGSARSRPAGTPTS